MRIRAPLIAVAAGAAVTLSTIGVPRAAERTVLAPVPARDVKPAGDTAVAVLAGGCFWGIEAVFSHVRGVRSVVSGYAGGTAADATYDKVASERTAHAEAVRIVYDPRVVSYATLLRIFFSVAHDPTQLNRQGPDVGRSYRSAIFPQSPEQAAVARAYLAQLDRSGVWGRQAVTRIEGGRFFPAERHHQDFAFRNPSHPYIVRWDAPKLSALRATFPQLWRANPAT